MQDKVLVEIIVPEIEETYNAFIPINKKVGHILFLVTKAINDMTNNSYKILNNNSLYNKVTGERYNLDLLIRDTNIRNGTQLVLL